MSVLCLVGHVYLLTQPASFDLWIEERIRNTLNSFNIQVLKYQQHATSIIQPYPPSNIPVHAVELKSFLTSLW
jgi:hypothetical protein